jgi:F420-dependent oxidoreductase-like protein
MRVSISITNYTWPSGAPRLATDLVQVAQAADAGGVDTLWVTDHLVQADPTAPPSDRDMLEAYTVLGFLAAHTKRARLGAMVSPVTFREPGLLVKAVTTLDVLSGGRAWLGIGAGYHGTEAEAMGLPLPPTAERFDRLEETLQIAQRMWSGDASRFDGVHYRLADMSSAPAPVSSPRPPILIGGTGEQRTLKLVAQYADACNVFDIPDGGQTIRHKLDVLAGHCADVGRPYDQIEKTLSTRLDPGESSDEFVQRARAAAMLGIEHLVVITSGAWPAEALATLAAAIPELEEEAR